MNWISFLRLIHQIYFRKGLPDLDWIQKQGLLAVKLGQIHALRIDFLEEDKCRHLARLYRHTDSVPAENTLELIHKQAGETFLDNFSEFDMVPLASASIGQVHRARRKSGEDVAVKLVKGDFKRSFYEDVANIKRLFRFIFILYPRLQSVANPVGILEDIEKYTTTELDLRNEARSQAILKSQHDKYSDVFDLSRMDFARVHGDISGENVLVAEFVEGPTFDELLEQGKMDYGDLIEFFKIFGFSVFVAGVFHGDIHPGNIILRNGKYVFIDCAYLGDVSRKIRVGLFRFFKHLSHHEYDACAFWLNEMSILCLTGKDYETFREKLRDLYSDFKGASVSKISLTKKMMETISLGVMSGMVFEKGIFPVIRALMYMDGMVLKCRPDAVLMDDMRPQIESFEKVLDKIDLAR